MHCDQYVSVIREFLARQISAAEVGAQYTDMFQKQPHGLPEDVFNVLERLFLDLDTFCPDPSLRAPDSISEVQLREYCQEALNGLQGCR